jgi:hypothetical protein
LTLVEHQPRTGGSHWTYAPEVLLIADAGAQVVGVRFTLPGLGSSMYCWALRSLAPGLPTELSREVYGDYELTVDWSGRRAAPGIATVLLDLVDADGRPGRVVAAGPVVSGGYPTTYTGGAIADPWDCGEPYPVGEG